MELRRDAAVGNMTDILGFGRGLGGALMVAKVGMRVDRSHFSPTEAMEETWAMMCGWGVGFIEGLELVGMEIKIRFRASKPHSPTRSCSSPSNWPDV